MAAGIANCFGQPSAPDLSEASLEQLGKIKVYSASKHLESAENAPSSVTVITADDIQQHGYRTLADILSVVRGFFVNYDRNYASLGVRGFARPSDFNSRVLLLVDGHRLNDNVYDQAMIGTEFPIDIDLVQRVEIIRGPVSSLYGSNAFFAVINVVTKHGSDLEGLEFSSEAASFNTYKGRISYGRKLQPWEFLVSGSFYGSRGHNRLFYPEFNTSQTNYGIASHVDDDQLGSALATVSYRDFTLQSVYGIREKGIPTGSYGTLFNNPGTRSNDAHLYIDLRYQHTFARSWDLSLRAFYDRYTYQGTYMYASPDNPEQVDPNLDFAAGKWWGTEMQVTKTVHRNHVTVGGEYRDNIRQNQSNYSINPYAISMNDKRTSFVDGIFLQDEFSITPSLTLNAGFRYDYYSMLESNIDPRAALIYCPWTGTAFKFIYGEAFRAPNVYEMYYSVPPNLPNFALRPENIRSTEFVWEQGLGNRLWFSTSIFYDSIRNLITSEDAGNDETIFRNLKAAKSAGVELEVKGQTSRGLEGGASYSFQQTKDRATNEFLSNSPRSLVKLNLSQPLWRRKAFVSLDAQYRSPIQFLTGASIAPFTVINATLFTRRLGKHVDFSASVYNFLDKKYFDAPSREFLQSQIQQDGRSVGFKMTWHLGER